MMMTRKVISVILGVLIGCGVITAGVNLIYLGCSPWIL